MDGAIGVPNTVEPRNTVTNGKNLAVLTGDRFNQGFVTRKCMAVLPRGEKKWPYYRSDRKAGVPLYLSVHTIGGNMVMNVWFPLNYPIKPCSMFDKIC